MNEIIFWKDKGKGLIDPTLFSVQAEKLAEGIGSNAKQTKLDKRTQIRKFFDEVTRLNGLAKAQRKDEEWDHLLPYVHMLVAKATYAYGRNLVSKEFHDLMKRSVNQVSTKEDLDVFANFFEAFMGFYRHYGPTN